MAGRGLRRWRRRWVSKGGLELGEVRLFIMEESIRVTEAGRHSALLLLPEEGFHTTVILDPGAGPGVNQHGDDVLVAHTRSERQDVLPWWPIAEKNVSRPL